ncbi:helix-turn-helix domain-containing protein [Rhizomonospora bruguierae]|uniref:helix-turn-helix domain-containing protein n=1 Tax=Rhizomonospora bruguierae TaxID=1581705 RepID=UPI001BD031E4|nr:helix-turn-helix domain-containing protein [Micromonospora sp. NBRC 107566]
MPATDLPDLGDRIRAARLRRGVSLRALARDVGVSASMISQIETGKSRPSVSTLYAITSALGMSVEEVFAPAAEPAAAPPSAVDAVRAAAAARTLADPPPGLAWLGPVVRPHERQTLRLDSGVTWERLGELPGQSVDFLLVTYAPGATSSSNGALMRHAGCEYGLLLRGELVLTLGFTDSVLRAGDAISFDSTTPHGYRNDATEPAVGVWFVMEDGTVH